ncbi:hypothetical protein HPB48_023089 [Haemaphysalis longicornis]|uniref:Uncharacterized protein n=1 Tax=Haemaphysalis longicornis TaxID=44386 RepID=A0A9J6GLP1_HAELO|nr:hypothetical protein HPB48_023089 [Haemaphysalis longicornis]
MRNDPPTILSTFSGPKVPHCIWLYGAEYRCTLHKKTVAWVTVAPPAHSPKHELATVATYETRSQTTPAWPSARCAKEITSRVPKVAQNDTRRRTSSGTDSGSNSARRSLLETRPLAVHTGTGQQRQQGMGEAAPGIPTYTVAAGGGDN